MRQLQRLGQQVDLAMTPRARYPVVHLLQQRNVRLAVRDGFNNPLKAVPAIDSADSLVNVVSQQPKLDC
jgi:hypothetical protein